MVFFHYSNSLSFVKNPFLLIIYIICGSVLAACNLIETSDNGELDGYWQMARVDTLATGGSCDMTQSHLFWAVQVNLLQVSDTRFVLPSCLLRFEHQGDELRLSNPYLLDRANGDKPLTDANLLQPYGIGGMEERFTVERLDGKQMRLRSDRLLLYFNRY